jgi:hypothetical protein
MSVSHQQDNDYAIEHLKISHHAHDGFLLVLSTWAVRTSSAACPNFVRAPVAVTDRRGFPAPHQRPGISLQARPSFGSGRIRR